MDAVTIKEKGHLSKNCKECFKQSHNEWLAPESSIAIFICNIFLRLQTETGCSDLSMSSETLVITSEVNFVQNWSCYRPVSCSVLDLKSITRKLDRGLINLHKT